LSQPCSSNSAICCSRGPKRTGFSSIQLVPRGEIITDAARGRFSQVPRCKRPSPSSRKRKHNLFWPGLQKTIAFTVPSDPDFPASCCVRSHIGLGRRGTRPDERRMARALPTHPVV
jgi:hypothetical protein